MRYQLVVSKQHLLSAPNGFTEHYGCLCAMVQCRKLIKSVGWPLGRGSQQGQWVALAGPQVSTTRTEWRELSEWELRKTHHSARCCFSRSFQNNLEYFAWIIGKKVFIQCSKKSLHVVLSYLHKPITCLYYGRCHSVLEIKWACKTAMRGVVPAVCTVSRY